MNCWEFLGIPATNDVRAIKRSYTRLLRKYQPELDPAGFQQLRQAYDIATAIANQPDWDSFALNAPGERPPRETVAVETPQDSLPGILSDEGTGIEGAMDLHGSTGTAVYPIEEPANAPLIIFSDNPGFPGPGLPTRAALEMESSAHMKDAQAILAAIVKDFPDHDRRQSVKYWQDALDADALWNLDAKAWLGLNLFLFLGQKNLQAAMSPTEVHIPKEAWIHLDDAFGWLENEVGLYGFISEEIVNSVLDPVRSARGQKMTVDLATTGVSPLEIGNAEDSRSRWTYAAPFLGLVIVHLINQCSQ
jgi:hypothetical protein